MRVSEKAMSEHAVSPVVGVMLMLVVTIIIAAVVSAFAGGLGSGTKATPSAAMDVKIVTGADDGMGGTTTKILFEMLSGDAIPTKDLSIVTYFTNETGGVYKTSHTASSTAFDLYGYGTGYTRLPYLNDAVAVGIAGDNPKADFGNYTASTGDIMAVGSTRQVADFLGLPWTAGTWPAPDTIDDPSFKTGAVVDIKVLHVPSNKYIFNKEVVVK
ncbi:type IV pilin N-terminal domain-containing protein [Methanoregula sp.]|uniref:type IV pilin N-terminal domain-containing protein n=1 Tax=Methanoregula sp. TaxID=2052170 RepID=UPI002374D557|nr:type IV pilin N-terminal domain-containing protein [Methanoregula sp.]MDD1686696.1 type IV pilin N-terminal domain-containing protein [Methanoregula sp.]